MASKTKKIKSPSSYKSTQSTFRPTREVISARTEAYKSLDTMIEVKTRTYPQFSNSTGLRTLKQFIDDSDRRLNSYTPTREEQDKEEWQENVFDPITRNKLKAIVAAVALQIPQLDYTAVNKQGMFSVYRAEFVKQLVNHSRNITNPALDVFFEAWELCGKGTVVKYDGYLKTKQSRKIISSFDQITGDIKFTEEEVIVDDRPIDVNVPLSEFYWMDMGVFDVQDQEEVAWVKNYKLSDLQAELGHYANFKYVKDKKSVSKYATTQENYFMESWKVRVKDEDDYEVYRRYCKKADKYEIWVNGVPLLLAPMLWGKVKKLYPFSKTIFEPFTGKDFFCGASLPGLLEGNQDIDNKIWNSILDKLYRSLKRPMLVGLANKDLLDIEDEYVDQDNKIYVPDVTQVKEYPFNEVSNADTMLMSIASRKLDAQSVDSAQQGLQGKGVTAREILVADEYARKLKGIFFMFLEDLWIQKTRIRIPNILLNYMTVKTEKIIGKDGAEAFKDVLTIYNVKNVKFSDGTHGTLGIQVVKNKTLLPTPGEIAQQEDVMNQTGINYKLIAVTQDYLDDWEIDFTITSQSVLNQDKIKRLTEMDEKMNTMAKFFPDYFVANKDLIFNDFISAYDDSQERYKKPAPPVPALKDTTPAPEAGGQVEQPTKAAPVTTQ